jgi:hypothetical protein
MDLEARAHFLEGLTRLAAAIQIERRSEPGE